jgi:hypothetical protein
MSDKVLFFDPIIVVRTDTFNTLTRRFVGDAAELF